VIEYPKPDGVLSFDILDNLAKSGVNHDDQQPAHLRVKPEKASIAESTSLDVYAGPEQRFCPAKVYEYQPNPAKGGKMELVINAQNCVHCKCCSIKTADEFIKWTVPEGGGGPQYAAM
jgi:electron-transferring-flavoprotein dehydrogenase